MNSITSSITIYFRASYTFYNMVFFRSIDLRRLPVLGEEPNQPKSFLLQKKQNKNNNPAEMLHYDSVADRIFCYLCVTILKTGKMKADGNINIDGNSHRSDKIAKFMAVHIHR